MPGLTPLNTSVNATGLVTALEGEIAVEHVVVPVGPHCGGYECRGRELGDVEEIGGLDVSLRGWERLRVVLA